MPFRFLDAWLGRDKLPQAKPDRLFALVTATVSLQEELGWVPTGRAGLCVKVLPGADFERARQEISDLLKLGAQETHSQVQVVPDELGYLWVVVADPDLDDQVNLIHLTTGSLVEQGYGPQLLAAVFRFGAKQPVSAVAPPPGTAAEQAQPAGQLGQASQGLRAYWVFNYKRGNFYPFVPLSESTKTRNSELEWRAGSLLARELPTESDQSRWYALWNCPV